MYSLTWSIQRSKQCVKFIKEVYVELSFKKLRMDNWSEFANKNTLQWGYENEVELYLATTYHHTSNGRVERVNETLREALKKVKGSCRSGVLNLLSLWGQKKNKKISRAKFFADIQWRSPHYLKTFEKGKQKIKN